MTPEARLAVRPYLLVFAIVDVDRREVVHLMLREADLQVGGHPRHRVDWDRDSFTAPDVAFLEQDMRHTAITAVDEPGPTIRSPPSLT